MKTLRHWTDESPRGVCNKPVDSEEIPHSGKPEVIFRHCDGAEEISGSVTWRSEFLRQEGDWDYLNS